MKIVNGEIVIDEDSLMIVVDKRSDGMSITTFDCSLDMTGLVHGVG